MSKRNRVLGVVLGTAVVLMQLPSDAMPTYSPWSTPVSVGDVVNSTSDDYGGALSKNGLSLYFTSAVPLADPQVLAALPNLFGNVFHEVDPEWNAVDVHEYTLRAVGIHKPIVQSSRSVLRVLSAVTQEDARQFSGSVG